MRLARWALLLLVAVVANACFYGLDGSLVNKKRDGAVDAAMIDGDVGAAAEGPPSDGPAGDGSSSDAPLAPDSSPFDAPPE